MMKRAHLAGDPVPVSRPVLDGLEAVRRSGATNMLDRTAVARVAERLGFAEAARWVRRHPDEYGRGVFQGFTAEEGR